MPFVHRFVPLLVVIASACATSLPDPESAGAQLYGSRCSGCHRVYLPGIMTAAMWTMQVDRMQEEMSRRGVKPLDAAEREIVLGYLRAHATDAVQAAPAGAGG
jgi:cytochrome c5